MKHNLNLEALILAAEKEGDELEQLDPDHELLVYDMEGKSDEEQDVLVNLFYANFAPEGANIASLSDQELELIWTSYLCALQAAVAVLKAQYGLFKPL